MSALSCALLAPQAAHAQWVVQDGNGNSIPSNTNGSYPLVVNATGHTANTYPQALLSDVQAGYADPIWLGCFTPHPFGNPYQDYPYFGPDSSGLMTSSGTDDLIGSVTASNYTTFTYGNVAGTYINASGSYPLNGGVTMDTSAPLFAKFVWSPSTPRTPAPDHLDVLVETNLEVNAYISRSGLSASASASASLGSVNEQLAADTSAPDTQIVIKKKLVRLPVARGSAILSGQSSVNVSASNSVAYDMNGQTSVGGDGNVSVSVKPDNRELTLSSSLGQTYHKDQNTGARTPDVRDANGTLNLTTLNSYHSYQTTTIPTPNGPVITNVDNPLINTVTFTPNFSGWDYVEWEDPRTGTTSDVPNVVNPDTWQWSPNNSSDYWDTGICQMPWGNISYQDGEAQGTPTGSKTYSVSYTATDNADGTTATANAIASLHDQWEDLVDDPANPPTQNEEYVYAYTPDGAKIGVQGEVPSASWNVSITATASLALNFNASFKLSDFVTLGGAFNPSISATFGVGLGVTSPAIHAGFTRFPFVHLLWKTKHYLVDHYTVSGFDGTYQQSAGDPGSKEALAGWSDEYPIGQTP